MTLKVTKLALASRLIVLAVQFISNCVIPDHRPDVFRMPQDFKYGPYPWMDKLVMRLLGGMRHWDGEYFMHIANHLYTYENSLAFYPLYPVMVRYLTESCTMLGIPLAKPAMTLLVAVVLNIYLFCETANLLYQLTQSIFNDFNKSWNAALIYCFNPATIFFSATYSETLFSYMSFFLMLECVRPNQEFKYLRIVYGLTGCLTCRSNGLLTLGFPIYFFGRHIILTKNPKRAKQIIKMIFSVISSLAVLHAYYFYIYRLYCMTNVKVHHTPEVIKYAEDRKYLLSGQGPDSSPWCNDVLPFPYSYVQSHYWDVGFLRYYQWKQLPNFLLALPMLLFMHYHCCDYFYEFVKSILPKKMTSHWKELLKEHLAMPFVLHGLLLTIVCTLFVHIQVSTRLLASATPIFYWFGADHLPKSMAELKFCSKAGALFIWCTSYALIGTVLFSNNYPWT